VPLPWGGKARAMMVDLDPVALYAKGLSAFDVSTAVAAQNVILRRHREDRADRVQRPHQLVARRDRGAERLPVKQVGDATIYLRDVAQVHDGFQVQTSQVHVDGRRSALLTVLKTPTASTLDIVRR